MPSLNFWLNDKIKDFFSLKIFYTLILLLLIFNFVGPRENNLYAQEVAKIKLSLEVKNKLIQQGKSVYMSKCIACHNIDPRKNGVTGPMINGASLELITYRVLKGTYPPGYVPKRKTKLMRPLPYLKDQLEVLHLFLNSF
jgi:hypothetical protein